MSENGDESFQNNAKIFSKGKRNINLFHIIFISQAKTREFGLFFLIKNNAIIKVVFFCRSTNQLID